MSRSYRKNVFGSWVNNRPMKGWRTQENRRLRHNAKQLINTCEDYDALIIPVLNDYDTLWGSPQDGRKRLWDIPAINECQLRSRDHKNYGYRLNSLFVELNEQGHLDNCQCYTNKKAHYWRMKRK